MKKKKKPNDDNALIWLQQLKKKFVAKSFWPFSSQNNKFPYPFTYLTFNVLNKIQILLIYKAQCKSLQ